MLFHVSTDNKNNEENKKFLNDAEIADVIPSDYIFIIFFLGYPASPIIDILCLTQVCLFVSNKRHNG